MEALTRALCFLLVMNWSIMMKVWCISLPVLTWHYLFLSTHIFAETFFLLWFHLMEVSLDQNVGVWILTTKAWIFLVHFTDLHAKVSLYPPCVILLLCIICNSLAMEEQFYINIAGHGDIRNFCFWAGLMRQLLFECFRPEINHAVSKEKVALLEILQPKSKSVFGRHICQNKDYLWVSWDDSHHYISIRLLWEFQASWNCETKLLVPSFGEKPSCLIAWFSAVSFTGEGGLPQFCSRCHFSPFSGCKIFIH